jgi:type I restriction enzyme S subunit
MSSDWPVVKLGALADFQEGYVNPSQREPSYFDGPVKWLRATDLNDSLVTDTSRTLSEKGFRSAGKSAVLFEPGTLAISKSGTIGRLGMLGDYMCGNRAVINIKPRPNSVPRYLFFVLRHLRPIIETLAEGSVQKNLYVSTLSNLDVPAPPKEIQQALADTLGVLDDRITLLRETNATLEAIAKALFKSWFVDFDPVRARMEGRAPEGMDEATAALFPDSFEETELGKVPRGWRVGTLADLSELNPESWTARKHPETVAYVDLANAKDNEIAAVTDYAFGEAPSRARRVLRSGDTIVGTVRPGNRSFAFIYQPPYNLTGSTGFAVLRPSAIENTEFVYLAATQDSSIEHLTHVADGGAYPAVRPEVVASLACVIPPGDIFALFHSVAETLLAKVAEDQRQAQTLATLRDTLLPRLISGQLRLPEAQAELEAA